MNSRPVAAGIQKRSTCSLCISQVPTDLTTPDDRMKLAHNIEASTSDTRRPSMKPKTSPQIMPSGTPLRNKAATFHGAGTIAKATSASQDRPIRPRMATARWRGAISDTTFMPMNFDSA